MHTTVKEIMRPNPVIIDPDSTLKEAAQRMDSVDCGVLPVGSWDKLEGIITDRDIVLRAVARGLDVTQEKVRDHMTPEVFYCSEDDTLEKTAELMREHQVNRLVVQNNGGRACGIITFGCILRKNSDMRELDKVIECAVGKKAA